MQTQYRKVKRYLEILKENRWQEITPVPNIGMLPCDYKTDNTLPDPALFCPFAKGEHWGEGDLFLKKVSLSPNLLSYQTFLNKGP